MNSMLKSRSWLKRVIEVPTANGPVLVTYNGRGRGTETVAVENDKIVTRSRLWFVPRFELVHNNDKFVIQVRVWPWLTIRSLTVQHNDELIYSEGSPPYLVTRKTEVYQAICCCLIVAVILLNYLLAWCQSG
jgi:hypothetical protein